MDDQKFYVHLVMTNTDEAAKVLNQLDSLKNFQSELKQSNPKVPPIVKHITLVESSYEIF